MSFPEVSYDLVTAMFLHARRGHAARGDPAHRRRGRRARRHPVHRRAPGPPPWDPDAHPHVHLPGADEVLTSLGLPDGEWEVLHSGEHERLQTAPDGRTMTRTDNALKLRRHDA